MLPSEIPKLPTDPLVRGFPGIWKSPSQLPPQDGSLSLTLLSLFLSFIFCPTSFRREWAAFLGVQCPLPGIRSCFVQFTQRLSVFWWICGEESGLPVLLLHQLRATPTLYFFKRLIFWNLVSVPHIHSHTDFNINFGKLKFDVITSCAKMNNDSPEFSDKNRNCLVWHYCCSVVAKLCLILWQPHGL